MAMLNNQMVYHISHDLPIMMDPILPQVSWSTTPCCNGVVRTLGTRQRCWFLGWGGWGGVGLSPSLAFTHVLGVGWVGLTTFSCTCTHTSFGWGLWAMSCYDSRCSLALAQTCHTTPEDVLLHMHRHIMLRRTSFFASGFFALEQTRHCTLVVRMDKSIQSFRDASATYNVGDAYPIYHLYVPWSKHGLFFPLQGIRIRHRSNHRDLYTFVLRIPDMRWIPCNLTMAHIPIKDSWWWLSSSQVFHM